MNIANHFFEAAKRNPTRTAIVDKQGKISYQQLQYEVRDYAIYLRQNGVKPGDRILVFVPMSIELYRVVLAIFSIGATAVFVDEWVNLKRLRMSCKMADCKALIAPAKIRWLSWLFPETRAIQLKLSEKKPANISRQLSTATDVSDAHPALVTFTTGSTGTPKAALRTHGFLAEQFRVLVEEIEPSQNDIDMVTLPIVLFINLGLGSTSIIPDYNTRKPQKLDVRKVLNQLQNYKVNRLTGSPYFVLQLAEEARKVKPKLFLAKIFLGGAPVFPKEAEQLTAAFNGIIVKVVYGSTEAEPIAGVDAEVLSKSDIIKNGGLLVGSPNSNIQLKVIKITAKEIAKLSELELRGMELKEGEIGEIIVAGKHVLKSYYKGQEAMSQNKIRVGEKLWHRTGDSGFGIDVQLYLTGRCKFLSKSNNGFLSLLAVEAKLAKIEGVNRGTMLTKNGKRFLIVESQLSSKTLKGKLHSLPFEELKVLTSLPLDARHNSKIDYDKLMAGL